MNTRTTFIVLLIAIALATYFVIFELGGEDGDTRGPLNGAAVGQRVFADVDSTEIDRITIRRAGEADLIIERDGTDANAWRQVEPVHWPVKAWMFDDLADAAATLRYTRQLDDDGGAAKYGLDPSQIELYIVGDDIEHTIRIGKEAAAGQAFVAVDDRPGILVVDKSLHEAVSDLSPETIRSAKLTEISANQVTSIALTGDGRTIELQPRDGRWAFTAGASGRVNADAVEDLVGAISFAEINDFIADHPDDLNRYGLAEPARVLHIETGEQTHVLRIGDAADLTGTQYYAMWDDRPVVFTLAKAQADVMNRKVEQLRDPRLTPAARGDLREIEISRADADDLRFVMSEGRWTSPGMAGGVELGAVSDLITQLLQTRAVGYAESMPEPATTVRLAVAGQDEVETLAIAQSTEGEHLRVRRNDEAVVYQVRPSDLSKVFEPRAAYRNRTVLDVEPTNVDAIVIEHAGAEARTHRIHREDGQWQLAGIDEQAFKEMLARLSPLKARTWVDREPGEANVTLTITPTQGQPRVVRLDRDAMIGWTDAGVFELHATVMDTLTAELRERTIIDADVEEIQSISRGDVTLSRVEGQWSRSDGQPIDAEQVGQLIDNLAGLRAERFIAAGTTKYDPADPSFELHVGIGDDQKTLNIWLPTATDRPEPIARLDDGPVFTLPAGGAEQIIDLTASVLSGRQDR